LEYKEAPLSTSSRFGIFIGESLKFVIRLLTDSKESGTTNQISSPQEINPTNNEAISP
jgi:hypothetical protein